VSYPTEWGEAAVPMHRVLKYDARFKTAVMQVFGKTMVCQTRDVAEKVGAGRWAGRAGRGGLSDSQGGGGEQGPGLGKAAGVQQRRLSAFPRCALPP
jgi:hypothetical protein